MPFRDPLYHFASIDDSNYLKPKIENFLDKNDMPATFYQAIETLIRMRDVLRVAQEINRIGEIPYVEYYRQSIQWLNGEIPLSTWSSVPQISSYVDIDETSAANFNSHVQTTFGQINSQALFQQIQIMQGVIKNSIVDSIRNDVKTPLEEDFNRTLLDARTNLVQNLNDSQTQKESTINSLYQAQLEEIRKTGQDAIANFEGARALANWSAFYAKRVGFYERAVTGMVWPENAIHKKWTAFKKYRMSLAKKERFKTSLQFRHGLINNLRKATSIWHSKVTSYSGKRTFWFGALIIGILIFILMNFMAIYGTSGELLGFDLSKLKPEHADTQIFAKIAIYAAVLLIPTIGYSFANKNFRIYCNLLEQYRHREVVAETIQGILAKPRGDDTDEAVRKELANVASVALFEQKTVGHLSKNEANSASLFDIARIFKN